MERKDFIAKFVADASAISTFPDAGRREEVAGQLFDAQMEARNSVSEWPEVWNLKTLVPGLIKYEDPGIGVLYVDKDSIDRMASTIIGKPVVNLVHKNIEPSEFRQKADGLVTDYFWGPDGWFRARVFIWDEATKRTAREFANSCAFLLPDMTGPGKHNGIAYDHKLVRGEFTHIAIVSNPRLEGAANEPVSVPDSTPIVHNSEKEEKTSMLMKIWKKIAGKEAQNAVEVAPDKQYRIVDGEKVSLKDMVAAHQEELAEEKKRKELEEATANELGEDEEVEVDGSKVPVKQLLASYNKRKAAKNAAAEEEEKKRKEEEAKNALDALKEAHEKGEHKEKAAENCGACTEAKNALVAENARKEEERKTAEAKKLEAQNALATAHNSKAHEKDFIEDCPECKKVGREAFNALREAAEKRGKAVDFTPPEPKTLQERAAEGSAAHS